MGKGIDAARLDAPEHTALLDDLKDQLLIVFLKRLGRTLDVPVAEIDDTGGEMLAFSVDSETRDSLWGHPDLLPTSNDIDDPSALIARLTGPTRTPDAMDDAIREILDDGAVDDN